MSGEVRAVMSVEIEHLVTWWDGPGVPRLRHHVWAFLLGRPRIRMRGPVTPGFAESASRMTVAMNDLRRVLEADDRRGYRRG